MKRLTDRQHEVLQSVADYYVANGYMPTFQEVADILGMVSKNAVHCHFVALRKKGYLESVNKGKARSLRFTEKAIKLLDLKNPPMDDRVYPFVAYAEVLQGVLEELQKRDPWIYKDILDSACKVAPAMGTNRDAINILREDCEKSGVLVEKLKERMSNE